MLQKKKCSSQQAGASHTVIKVIRYVIRDLRGRKRKSLTSNHENDKYFPKHYRTKVLQN